MSYSSKNELKRSASLTQVIEVIKLLGYKSEKDNLPIPNRVGSFMWYEAADYKSWVGVELDVYKTKTTIKVETRTRVGRSYWDLTQQNKTIKTLRNLFGGHFVTDGGRNRTWQPEGKPPPPLSSGCFLARWRLHNALGRARVYLMTRKLEGDIARDKPSGLAYLDHMNPRLLSNNLLIPYIIAVWEAYFRSTFSATFKYATKRETVLKKARLSHSQLEHIVGERGSTEDQIAQCFSFQRPSSISENFRLLDSNLDIAAALRKPYKGRKVNLYDSIESIVERRNAFVHAGDIDITLYDKALETTLSDIVEAVNRSYAAIGARFNFSPIHNY